MNKTVNTRSQLIYDLWLKIGNLQQQRNLSCPAEVLRIAAQKRHIEAVKTVAGPEMIFL
jgi:hypothetical protein